MRDAPGAITCGAAEFVAAVVNAAARRMLFRDTMSWNGNAIAAMMSGGPAAMYACDAFTNGSEII